MTTGFYIFNDQGGVDRVNTIRNADGYWDAENHANPPLGFVWAETLAEAFAKLLALHDAERLSERATPADIKAEAERRIFSKIAPITRQLNMTARTLDLTNAYGADPTQWPAEAQAERAAYYNIYSRILAMRAHSDTLELDPPLLGGLATAGWPE